MSSPDTVNPFYPGVDKHGTVSFKSLLQLRQHLNWISKSKTGLSAAELWKEIKTGRYDSTPLKDSFLGYIWLLDGASLPDNEHRREQLLYPELRAKSSK